MKRILTTLALCVSLAAAGCLGAGPEATEADPKASGAPTEPREPLIPNDGDDTTTRPEEPGLEPIWDDVGLVGCEYQRVVIKADRERVQSELPGDHSPQQSLGSPAPGAPTDAYLWTMTCDAVIMDNETVIPDAHIAFSYLGLHKPRDSESSAYQLGFVLEAFTDVDELHTHWTSQGWPSQPAEFSSTQEGGVTRQTIKVEDGVAYELTHDTVRMDDLVIQDGYRDDPQTVIELYGKQEAPAELGARFETSKREYVLALGSMMECGEGRLCSYVHSQPDVAPSGTSVGWLEGTWTVATQQDDDQQRPEKNPTHQRMV